MYRQVSRILAGLLLGISPMWATAGLNNFPQNPGFGEPSYSQAELDQAFGQGKTTGRLEASGDCLVNPDNCGCSDGINPCGVTLSSVLSGAEFGETEPNDHIVAADGLIPEHLFWGQTPWLQDKVGDWHRDEDWFYLTTNEPNQLLTINFTVPDRVLADSTRLSQGWLVSVRDAAGNVYAQFDTRFALDDANTPDKNESKEINYPVFLGHTGTYYISVEPRVDDGAGGLVIDPTTVSLNDLSVTFSPYTMAVVLEFSGLDNVPPDVNFHDVEIEPNNDNTTANPLTSGVTMFGLLRQTTGDVGSNPTEPTAPPTPTDPTGNNQFLQTDVDVFKYTSAGHEQVSLAWCGREECKAFCGSDTCTDQIFWFVEVTDSDNNPLVSFNTNKAETVHFGLDDPGDYFVSIDFERTVNAFCSEFSETEFICLQESIECLELDTTVNEGATAADSFIECEYGSGNSCGTPPPLESTVTIECARTDNGDNVLVEGCAGDSTLR